ncbi:MAG TPA: efflux RND transporter permease subunit [Candidatus Ignatzschineria merdigallinarum]|uniref:Efflux RND transporter permease subunit n=1 Tax=Candidatus Ignatzschineria merdigallinarum TaxID=2838621 RepID=A0A9D1Q5A3_9GAMM|nr:efflux RND transporter permease subunit [Candidatus Ignatzschineria merdigallinarum]
MKFTDLFIARPILSLAISLLMVMIGVFAFNKLPIRQYPLLESSTISISTSYPGASAEMIQGFITQPISHAVSSVEGIDYLTSTSTDGMSVVTARMLLNQDSSVALTEAMAKVNQIRYKLPKEAYDPVIERTAGDSTAVAYVAFSGAEIPASEMTEYISRVVEPLFSGIPGVAKLTVYGGQELSMRIWVDVDKLTGRNLTASDLSQALLRNNYQATPGRIDGEYVITNIRVNSDLGSLAEFEELVITQNETGVTRLKDVAVVELTSASTDTSAFHNGTSAVYLGFFPTPSANPLVIVDGIKQLLPAIEKTLPPGAEVNLSFETARFIDASINAVIQTLFETLVIVVLVIYLCLGSFRSVLIPVATIPLSMLGAAGLMYIFGFSVNLLTLLAMILAIGLVVDDAIVVVENIHRHIDEGKSPVAASIIAAREVVGPVIAMTITLAAVYAPIGFMGGLTGSLFKEFALTLAGSVLVSGVIALTLSPVMSSYLLKPHSDAGKMAKLADRFFTAFANGYEKLLRGSLNYKMVTGAIIVAIIASIPYLYQSAEKELAPMEDQANLLTAVKGPQHSNLAYTEKFNLKLEEIFKTIPETESSWIINGGALPSSSIGGIILHEWDKRDRSAAEVQAELQARVNDVEGSSIFVFQLAALPGSSGGLPVQLVLRTPGDYESLYNEIEKLKAKGWESGLFVVVDSNLYYNNPVVEIEIDRLKAASLGVSLQEIGDSLSILVGENYINRFGMEGRAYDVIPQSMPDQRDVLTKLNHHYVRSMSGELVPLSTFITMTEKVEPNQLGQFNQQNAATLEAILAPNITMGEAVTYLEGLMAELPAEFSHDWQSDSRQFTEEGNALVYAFMAAIIMIFLVLAAQYESVKDAFIILMTVPLSIFGALLPLALGFASLNIYTQIGLVTLIGLISKHGILIVEFANNLQEEGLSKLNAIIESTKIRLRPVIMTTAALVFGLIPLLFASGAGAVSRSGLGLVIITGMLIGTIFTLFVLPLIYLWLGRDLQNSGENQRQLEIDKVLTMR